MSIEGREITVGKTVYKLEELSIERTLRLTDIIFYVLNEMSDTVQKEFGEYVEDYQTKHDLVITPEQLKIETEEAEEFLDGLTPEQIQLAEYEQPVRDRLIAEGINPDELKGPVTLAANPSQEEVIGFFLPRAYKVARPELLTLFALVLARNADMADAEDKPGGVDGYLQSIANRVKHEGKTPDLISLCLVAWEVGKEEFDRIKTMGNVPAPLAGLFASPQASPNDEPTLST